MSLTRPEGNDRKLRSIYLSPQANKRSERLEIAKIFRQTNFGVGKHRKYNNLDELISIGIVVTGHDDRYKFQAVD